MNNMGNIVTYVNNSTESLVGDSKPISIQADMLYKMEWHIYSALNNTTKYTTLLPDEYISSLLCFNCKAVTFCVEGGRMSRWLNVRHSFLSVVICFLFRRISNVASGLWYAIREHNKHLLHRRACVACRLLLRSRIQSCYISQRYYRKCPFECF